MRNKCAKLRCIHNHAKCHMGFADLSKRNPFGRSRDNTHTHTLSLGQNVAKKASVRNLAQAKRILSDG